MKDTLLTERTFFRTGFIFIESHLDIESLSIIISKELLGDVPFRGLEEHIRDEIPAVYVNNILGYKIVLQGSAEVGYNLIFTESNFPHEIFNQTTSKPSEINISGNIYNILKNRTNLEIYLD